MGYEFLIKVKLTPQDQQEIDNLFKRKASYFRTSSVDGKEFYEFKNERSQTVWPDYITAFDNEGIYVGKNLTSDLWKELEDLQGYLLQHEKLYMVEEL